MTEIIGLVPAAGQALRVAPISCSKEIFPVGIDHVDGKTGPRPKVAAHYLLEQMQIAGARKAYIILRSGKWDIPEYFKDGSWIDLDIGYLLMREPFGVPYTLDQAYSFVNTATILFGFPDIIMFPKRTLKKLYEKLNRSGSDIVLAVFPAHKPEKMDMVELDANHNIRTIDIKPERTKLTKTWIAAAWTPYFTEYMHTYVTNHSNDQHISKELYLGDVIQSAIGQMNVKSVIFDNGRYLDIGTPQDLLLSSEFIKSAKDLG